MRSNEIEAGRRTNEFALREFAGSQNVMRKLPIVSLGLLSVSLSADGSEFDWSSRIWEGIRLKHFTVALMRVEKSPPIIRQKTSTGISFRRDISDYKHGAQQYFSSI